MSEWLVDTHALLWFLGDDDRLSERARATMVSGGSTLYCSAASVWEIAIKSALGKLRAPDDLLAVLHDQGFSELPIEAEDGWGVRALPLDEHRDPFDRMLVAQAGRRDLPIISHDIALDQYGIERHW